MMGITAPYYHGKGLNDETRPSGLAYERESIQHFDWLESLGSGPIDFRSAA